MESCLTIYPAEEVVCRVHQAMGEKIPIIVVHDFHASVSEEIVCG